MNFCDVIIVPVPGTITWGVPRPDALDSTMGPRFTLTETDQFLPCGEPLPRRSRKAVPPACARAPEELRSDDAPFPAVAIADPQPGWAPLPAHRREASIARRLSGYDIGPDPVYFPKPTAEPRVEVVGDLWWPEEGRGKAGRKFVTAPVVSASNSEESVVERGGYGPPRPGETPAAGIGSEYLRQTRNQTRTGLKLTRDCWGRVIP